MQRGEPTGAPPNSSRRWYSQVSPKTFQEPQHITRSRSAFGAGRKHTKAIRFQNDGAAASVSAERDIVPESTWTFQRENKSQAGKKRSSYNLAQCSVHGQRNRHPSNQYTPPERPLDIVEVPQITHSRVSLEIKPNSPLYTGGATLGGEVFLVIDDGKFSKRSKDLAPLYLGYATVYLVGVETWNGRHHIFQSLAIEIVNDARPPPSAMLSSSKFANGFWEVLPSSVCIPFQLSLPVKIGPPPYSSKHASIRYILCATVLLKTYGRDFSVRDSCDITILEVHNPDKEMTALPEPLYASDKIVLSKSLPFEEASLTAFLHREVWASGMSLFVDLQILNRSRKAVRKITIALERIEMIYHHAPTEITKGANRHSRLPDRVNKKSVKANTTERAKHGWHGISSQGTDERTWILDIPPGLATIPTGRFFGVRYFLHVSLSFTSTTRQLSVRIPVTIIDPNSLNIASNLIAEVASAIEEASQKQNTPPLPEKLSKPTPVVETRQKPENHLQTPPAKQAPDSWGWTPPRSTRMSLLPSPLLPTRNSQDALSKIAGPSKTELTALPRKDDTKPLTATGNGNPTTPFDIAKSTKTPEVAVSTTKTQAPRDGFAPTDPSALRFPPRDAVLQTEPTSRGAELDAQTISDLTGEVEKTPPKIPPRKARPKPIFFDPGLARMTLPASPRDNQGNQAPTMPRGQTSPPGISRVDGATYLPSPKYLSSTLAGDTSNANHVYDYYHIFQSPKSRKIKTASQALSISSRVSKSHKRGRSRVIFIHPHPLDKDAGGRRKNSAGVENDPYFGHAQQEVVMTSDEEGLWETIEEEPDLDAGPGPDIGSINVHPSKRYESYLKVENWDVGIDTTHDVGYDSRNVF